MITECIVAYRSIKSDVEALIAENQDDFFRTPDIQTRFIRQSPGVLIIYTCQATARSWRAQAASRKTLFRILPEPLLGSSV